jgi:hypothetical protein
MKKVAFLSLAILMFGFILVVDTFAQPAMKWKGGGGWGPATPYNRLYDPMTVETISGEVLGIEKIVPFKGMYAGVHLLVKTEKETISVHLGPQWYLENQDFKIDPKEKVEIKGSRITFQGKPALIAAEVKKGDEILKLRDESGFPVWSGSRRR